MFLFHLTPWGIEAWTEKKGGLGMGREAGGFVGGEALEGNEAAGRSNAGEDRRRGQSKELVYWGAMRKKAGEEVGKR